jgi:hypothetical protein
MTADPDDQIEAALRRRAAMQAPPTFTQTMMRRVAAEPRHTTKKTPHPVSVERLNEAAIALIVAGVLLLWNPARLGDWLATSLDWLQSGATALGGITRVNLPASLVFAALAVWIAGMLSDRMDLLD